MIKAFAALACAGAAASMASATATFTFDDPTGGNEVSVMGGNATYDASVVVELTVDAPDLGAPITFDTNLDIDFTISSPLQFSGTTFATIAGTFAWTDAMTGQSILSGSFDGGQLFVFSGVGGIVASGEINMGNLVYTPGELLTPPNQNVESFAALDASWTLTNIQVANGGNLVTDNGNGPEINDFTANSAFTGTALLTVVPAPGAVALFACGLGVASRRRR